MDWLTTMRDQLPLLLVLSPVIGFLVTLAATRNERDLVRHLAISNSFCTFVIFCGVVWQFELERSDEVKLAHQLNEEAATAGPDKVTPQMVQGVMDRKRVERLGQRWLVVDGTNLWPTFALVVLTGLVIWQVEATSLRLNWLFPNVLLFEAMSLTALTAYDLRVYLVALGISVLLLSAMIGQWGGPERRELAGRFLFAQYCGSSFIMFGFAMLVAAVPWMKIEDSPKPPSISWNIASIVYETQKWTSGNELSNQYENEVFPWILLVLSVGFTIQFGLFPFHSSHVAVLSHVPYSIAVLYVAGLLSSCGIGWLRFVVPLAPELLAAFDWLILIPTLGSAIWGSLRALVPGSPRQRTAFVFLSLSGLSLLGCFSFSRVSLSATWLMQQQLTIVICTTIFILSTSLLSKNEVELLEGENVFEDRQRSRIPISTYQYPSFDDKSTSADKLAVGRGLRTRTLLLMCSLPSIGSFACGYMLVSDLLRESVLVTMCAIGVCGLILLTVYSLLAGNDKIQDLIATEGRRFRGPMAIMLALGVIVNLFPNLMLRQCDPELYRVFRRFEPVQAIDSALVVPGDRQKLPK